MKRLKPPKSIAAHCPSRSRNLLDMRKFFRRVAILLTILLAVLVGAYLLRGPLFSRLIASRVEEALEATLGGRYTIDAVEGSWFGDLALVGLRTREEPEHGPLRTLEFGRAAVSYDLFGLLASLPTAAMNVTLAPARRAAIA